MALEESHILLINSGSGVVGVETLKNLVLPGVGNFTIQDSAVVSEADLGVNFFLEEEHLGGFRAEQTCNLLKELNPDVQGNFVTEVGQPLCVARRVLTLNAANRVMAHTTRLFEAVYPHYCSRPYPT
jgi:molybdopterin/thiamine biosynthesis adenylyltransferase